MRIVSGDQKHESSHLTHIGAGDQNKNSSNQMTPNFFVQNTALKNHQ